MNSLKQRPWLLAFGAVLIVVGLVVVWWLASPLFLNQSVEEAFPTAVANVPATAIVVATPSATLTPTVEATKPAELATAEAMPTKIMDEPMPTAAPEIQPVFVSSGAFKNADNFHKGAGLATIYKLPDDSQILRFEDFAVTNGPDLHVYLAAGAAPTGRENLGDYLDLGKLKGNVGSQNYAIPAGTDLSTYRSVVIYCQPFHVVFSTATLAAKTP